MLAITASQKTIFIKDGDNNTLRLVKTNNGVELHTTNGVKENKSMLQLGVILRKKVANPKSSKDSYEKRFNRLYKSIITMNPSSIKVLVNRLKVLEEEI